VWVVVDRHWTTDPSWTGNSHGQSAPGRIVRSLALSLDSETVEAAGEEERLGDEEWRKTKPRGCRRTGVVQGPLARDMARAASSSARASCRIAFFERVCTLLLSGEERKSAADVAACWV